MRPRVKICGITRREDALAAAWLGVDAIGLVFYPKSPRAVSIEQARAIVRDLPPFVSVVALFVDAQSEAIHRVLDQVAIDMLQFHGDERPADCARFGKPYLKAVRMQEDVDVAGFASAYGDAAGLLLDAYVTGVPGGTGVRFEWSRVPRNVGKPIILAGGLSPDNVGQAVAQAQPYGVDVSGGVEAEKGVKDVAKMAAFIRGMNDVQ